LKRFEVNTLFSYEIREEKIIFCILFICLWRQKHLSHGQVQFLIKRFTMIIGLAG